jgi:hypothetical protein
MFQFSAFASRLAGYHAFSMVGCPIRKSTDQSFCATPRSLSQLSVSFIASKSLGIPHTPLITFLYFLLENLLFSRNMPKNLLLHLNLTI